MGQVHVWEPGRRLVFSWRLPSFKAGQNTVVEVLFDPAPAGTRVTVNHRGWSSLPPSHPVRHGLQDAAFIALHGRWWAELLGALRAHVDVSSPDPDAENPTP